MGMHRLMNRSETDIFWYHLLLAFNINDELRMPMETRKRNSLGFWSLRLGLNQPNKSSYESDPAYYPDQPLFNFTNIIFLIHIFILINKTNKLLGFEFV